MDEFRTTFKINQVGDHGESLGLRDIHRVFSAPFYELTGLYLGQVTSYFVR